MDKAIESLNQILGIAIQIVFTAVGLWSGMKITKNKEVVQETVLKEYDDTYESLDPMRMREVVSDVRRLTPANNYGLVMGWLLCPLEGVETVFPRRGNSFLRLGPVVVSFPSQGASRY